MLFNETAEYAGSSTVSCSSVALTLPAFQADSDGSLWAMDRTTFRRIVLKSAFKKRQMYERLLESVPMLKTLEVSSSPGRSEVYQHGMSGDYRYPRV